MVCLFLATTLQSHLISWNEILLNITYTKLVSHHIVMSMVAFLVGVPLYWYDCDDDCGFLLA